MEIVTNILGAVARAIKRASPGVFETSLTIPDQLFPQIKLAEPLVFPTTAQTATVNQSAIVYAQGIVANGASIGGTLIVLGPGVWDLNFHMMYSSNYSSAPNAGAYVNVQQGDFASSFGNTELFLEAFCQPTAGGSLIIERNLQFVTENGAVFSWQLNVNGAGQSHGLSISLVASKLV